MYVLGRFLQYKENPASAIKIWFYPMLLSKKLSGFTLSKQKNIKMSRHGKDSVTIWH